MSVVIETTLGDLTVDLFTDERPIACLNFIKLCQLKYYNYNLFHTVQQGFIAQTGDPSGLGNGGSSVWGVVEGIQKRFFEAEYLPKIYHSSAGMLSLVSAGKNLVGSQFFFTLGENLTSLDGNHCVIGEVVEGHEVLRKLNDAIVDEDFRPYQDIRITHTVVLEDPFPNPRGFQVPSRSPSPSAERLQNGRIAADEDIDETNGKTMEEMQEMLAEREAKARATILEIVGDLPDAEMAPPENVLFVCKLNPVTTDDDLEIIFSRFGVVKGCEVIRDRKTGDSLQYAFVEFEDQKSCEAAYFKMDNVLIDDRRIHVDFSQSVSKVTWRGKGRGVVGDGSQLDFNNLRESNGKKHENKPRMREHEDRRGQGDRRIDRNRNDEQKRVITSEERRKAREQRHKEQREREDRGRRNNTQRSRSRETNGRHNERYERRRSRSNDRNVDRRRPISPYRGSRYSPERRRGEHQRDGSVDRHRRTPTNSQSDRRQAERKYKAKESENVSRDRKRVAVKEERASKKKSKRAKSSSSESSDSSDDSESSSTDSSDESSSDERSKRKKHSKSKQRKSKTKRKHKSKKKHKK